ncbi:MAG: amidase [Pseudomonadales bacterium]|nr:amidase [Pseudomonadales bacterium]
MRRREFLVSAAVASVGAAVPLTAHSQPAQIVYLDAISLSKAIHSREVSCVEVMAAYLEQIATYNKTFNAIVSMADLEVLLAAAQKADQDLASGLDRGWMHGFPIAIKDLANAKGFITTSGSPIFANSVAAADSVHVARMKAAGGIVIGKTNVPEFGLGSQSYNRVFGATKSAFNSNKTAGGSSGGAASALGLRMLAVADGSDMMGSLRNPGAFNNVIGFRPTPGVVPLGADLAETLACNGPMARTVTDTARLLATIAGPDQRVPNALPIDPNQFNHSLKRDWQGRRIGWLGDFDGYLPTEPGVMDVCETALQGFRAAGFQVDAFDLSYSMADLWQTWLTYRHWGNRARAMAMYKDPVMRAQLKPELIWEIEGGAKYTAENVAAAMSARGRWYQTLVQAFTKVDFLVLPTAQVFPFDADTHWPKEIAGKQMDTYHRWMEVVVPGTMSGCPVINVPAGFSSAGLPMGLQIIGPRYRDFEVLQAAYAYEQASRWNLDHLPPVLTEG